MALNEFFEWYGLEPRPGFTKATVSTWRVSLEARGLGSSSIIIRMSAIRKLATEAADNGLLAPELAAGISRVKSVKSKGIRAGNWLSLRQAQALLSAPDVSNVRLFHRWGGERQVFLPPLRVVKSAAIRLPLWIRTPLPADCPHVRGVNRWH